MILNIIMLLCYDDIQTIIEDKAIVIKFLFDLDLDVDYITS